MGMTAPSFLACSPRQAYAFAGYHQRVDESIPAENRKAYYPIISSPLTSGRPTGGDERSDVVLDEPALIASLPG